MTSMKPVAILMGLGIMIVELVLYGRTILAIVEVLLKGDTAVWVAVNNHCAGEAACPCLGVQFTMYTWCLGTQTLGTPCPC